jgi:hypothetical protein
MSSNSNLRRTLHFKFTLPNADSAQIGAMVKAMAPFYQTFGETRIRLLQNVDDPAKFMQEIEYEAPEGFEINRQQIASDARMQTYLQAWRSMFPGAVEVDVYKEV